MRIDINQKKISIGDKYQVFIDGEQKYNASSELFKLLSVINLYKKGEEKERLTIRKRWSWFKPKYDIQSVDGRTAELRAYSVWKMHYQCTFGPDIYNIYGHRGRKHSVYKNETQVAWWEKAAVSWFDGDNYSIIADNDCNVEFIIALCLIIDNHKSENHDSKGVNIDFGNIGGEVKKFNSDWRPR